MRVYSYLKPILLSFVLISCNVGPCVRHVSVLLDVGVPGPPGVIRVDEIGDTWVKLLWSKGADHNSPILYYTVQTRHFWALNEDDWKNASTCEYLSPPLEVLSLHSYEKVDVTADN